MADQLLALWKEVVPPINITWEKKTVLPPLAGSKCFSFRVCPDGSFRRVFGQTAAANPGAIGLYGVGIGTGHVRVLGLPLDDAMNLSVSVVYEEAKQAVPRVVSWTSVREHVVDFHVWDLKGRPASFYALSVVMHVLA